MRMVREMLMSKNAAASESSNSQSKSSTDIVEELAAPSVEVNFEEKEEETLSSVFRVIFVSCWGTKCKYMYVG